MIPDAGAQREALADAGADGWLLYAFHGLNPVATRVLELTEAEDLKKATDANKNDYYQFVSAADAAQNSLPF